MLTAEIFALVYLVEILIQAYLYMWLGSNSEGGKGGGQFGHKDLKGTINNNKIIIEFYIYSNSPSSRRGIYTFPN